MVCVSVCVCTLYITHSLSSWLIGPRPEFVDPQHVAQGEGRDSEFMWSSCSDDVN